MAWSCMPRAPWLWVILSRRPESSGRGRYSEDFTFATEPARVAGIDTLAGDGRSKGGGARGGSAGLAGWLAGACVAGSGARARGASAGLARWLAGAVASRSGFHAAFVAPSSSTQPAFPRDHGRSGLAGGVE